MLTALIELLIVLLKHIDTIIITNAYGCWVLKRTAAVPTLTVLLAGKYIIESFHLPPVANACWFNSQLSSLYFH